MNAAKACLRSLERLAAGEKGQVLSVVAQLNSRRMLCLRRQAGPGSYANSCWQAVLTKPQLLVMDKPAITSTCTRLRLWVSSQDSPGK